MGLKDKLHELKLKYQGTKMEQSFNALHTFLYMPNITTHSGSHVRDAADLKRVMNTVIMAMIPCLIFGIFNAGYQHHLQVHGVAEFLTFDNFLLGAQKIIPLIAISYGVGLGVEFLFATYKKHEVEEGYLVSGMLIPLIVPIDIPLWMLAIAVIFGVVIGKELFGGTGMNVLNIWVFNESMILIPGVIRCATRIFLPYESGRCKSEQISVGTLFCDKFLRYIECTFVCC
jgi:Na+-transporting NADH:ubiquinone oxidoreductase subunit B